MKKYEYPIAALSVLTTIFFASSCVPSHTQTPAAPQEGDPTANTSSLTTNGPSDAPREDPTMGGITLVPYFSSGNALDAARALEEDQVAAARRLFDEYRQTEKNDDLADRATFLSAYLAGRLGDHERALSELPALALDYPQLAEVAYEGAAQAALKLRQPNTTLEYLERIPSESSLRAHADFLRAGALEQLSLAEESVAAYQEYLYDWVDHRNENEAHGRIVEIAAHLSKRPGKQFTGFAEVALDHLNELESASPNGYWTQRASKFEDYLVQKLKLNKRSRPKDSADAHRAFGRAMDYKRRRSHDKAIHWLRRTIKLSHDNGKLECRARFELGVVVSWKRDHLKAGKILGQVADTCHQPSIRLKALFRAGKSYQSADKLRESLGRFEQVEAQFPHHSYADDARLHQARAYLALGNKPRFIELLETLPDTYPHGDMRSEALWLVALDAMENGDLDKAVDVLTRYYQLFPRESGWYQAGRSGYWLARVHQKMGNIPLATHYFEQVIAGSPLTYYMVMAYNRLWSFDSVRAETLVAQLAPQTEHTEYHIPADARDRYPRLATAIELLRLGLTTRAVREFDHMLDGPYTPTELHWIVSTILRKSGRYSSSRALTSGARREWREHYPSHDDHHFWTLAYPKAFPDAVANASATSRVTSQLIWAIMREESGFETKVVSWANAIGLMQLIWPTAKAMASRLDMPLTRQMLNQPDVNIKLGATYLSYLSEMYDSHPALVIAGYNAGEGAVARWVRERPGAELDYFIERIPFSQTRGYTKRVLATYATYDFLYGQSDPMLTLQMTVP